MLHAIASRTTASPHDSESRQAWRAALAFLFSFSRAVSLASVGNDGSSGRRELEKTPFTSSGRGGRSWPGGSISGLCQFGWVADRRFAPRIVFDVSRRAVKQNTRA